MEYRLLLFTRYIIRSGTEIYPMFTIPSTFFEDSFLLLIFFQYSEASISPDFPATIIHITINPPNPHNLLPKLTNPPHPPHIKTRVSIEYPNLQSKLPT